MVKVSDRNKHKIDDFIENPKKALFILALPTIFGMLSQVLYNIIDTAFVGRLGAEAIAALTFSFPIFFLMISISFGIGAGVSSLIARYMGAKKLKKAENTAVHGIYLSLAISIVLSILGIIFIKDMLNIFGASPDVLPLTESYLRILFYGMPLMIVSWSISSIFNGQGETKVAAIVQIVSMLSNIFLDYLFIFVFGMGISGAALATVISFSIGLLLGLVLMYSLKSVSVKIIPRCFCLSKNIIKDIFKVGLPTTLTNLLLTFFITVINIFMAYYGTLYVAAFGLGMRLESLATMPVVAISTSILTLVGMFYGAKRLDLVKTIIWFGIKISILFMIVIGLMFFIFPELFFRIFTSNTELLSISSLYMRLIVFTFPVMAITMNIARAMQGLGDGIPGLIITGIRVLIAFVPIAYLFVYVFKLGFVFVPIAMLISGVISIIVGIVWLSAKLKGLNDESI